MKKKKQQQKATGMNPILLAVLALLSVVLGVNLFEEVGLVLDIPPRPTPIAVTGGNAATSNNWYEIYFTNPTCPPEDQREGGIDEIIAADLQQAQQQVDMAAYELNSTPITDALIELRKRGLTVRVVTDTDNADYTGIRRLRRNGISVVEDKRSGLMHNKFIVIDGRITWVGSMNFTTNDVYCNNNNTVRIENLTLAANYLAELAEMYDNRQFGPTSPSATPNERFTIQEVVVENYFAPESDLSGIIAAVIQEAQGEILFMAFSFTHNQIGEAMLARARAGVQVRGVFETLGSDTSFSYYPIMNAAALPNLQVRRDGNPRMMHHKVIIIDRQTVIFGSYNFTDNANRRNDENIVIVRDAQFAAYFVEEFETIWAEARQ